MLRTSVTVEGVDFELIKTLVIRGIYVEDLHRDTLAYVGVLKCYVSDYDLEKMDFRLNKMRLENGTFHLKRYDSENKLNLQFILDAFKSDDTSEVKKPLLTCKEISVENLHFSFDDFNKKKQDIGVDFNHLNVRKINLSVHDFQMEEDTVSANISNFNFTEQSGFYLKELSGKAVVNPVNIVLSELELATNQSQINGQLAFRYDDYTDFGDFIEKIKIDADLLPTSIELADVAFFAPAIDGISKKVEISGKVKGTVNHLKGRKLDIKFGKHSRIKGRMDVDGLPNISETFIMLSVEELSTSKTDLDQIPLPPFNERKTLETPPQLARLGKITFKGDFTGFITDFVAFGNFNSALGNCRTDINMRKDTASDRYYYKGSLLASNFNIGKLLGQEELLGQLSMKMKVKGSGLKKETLAANLDGKITAIDLKGYRYSNVVLEGEVSNEKFQGKLSVNDKNILLGFKGKIDFEPELPILRFETRIKDANLAAINLLNSDSLIRFSTYAKFNLVGNKLGNITGSVDVLNTDYVQGKKQLHIARLHLLALRDSVGNSITTISSDFMEGEIKGDYETATLTSSFFYAASNLSPSFFDSDLKQPEREHSLSYQFEFFDTKSLTSIFYPDLSLPKKVLVTGNYDSEKKEFSLHLMTLAATWKGKDFIGFSNKIEMKNGVFAADVSAQRIVLSDSLWFDNVRFTADGTDDKANFAFGWDNEYTMAYKGNIIGNVNIQSKKKFEIDFDQSQIAIADSVWTISGQSHILIDSTSITVDGFNIGNRNQSLGASGKISPNSKEKLNIKIENFKLDNLNLFTEGKGIKLNGTVNGAGMLSGPYSNMLFLAGLDFKNIYLNDKPVGDGSFSARWIPKTEAVLISTEFKRENVKNLELKGYYYPKKEENNLDLKATITRFDLETLQPYVENAVSKLKGTASGTVQVKGVLAKPLLSGKINVQNANTFITYLNTEYTIDDAEITIKKDRFAFNGVILKDIKGSVATANGSILHDNFRDFNLDIFLNAKKDFQCLNTTFKQNNQYYGKAFVDSAKIHVKGPPDTLQITVQARTAKGTGFNIPLSGPTEVSETDFITFVSKDTLQIKKTDDYKVDLSGIQLKFMLDITDDATMKLIFDETVGDIIEAKGNGNVRMEINTIGKFTLFGEYVIEQGDYLFTLQNILNKKFIVAKGSNILWDGDPYEATLNIDAYYKLRASPYDITQNESHRKKVPVECHLYMTEKLSNPNIKFDILLPKASDEMQAAVNGKINNEEEKNKQVFSLLVLGSFMPNQSSGQTTSYSSSAAASSSEVLSNQLSNWLSQISNDFDVGVNYRPGNEISSEELEVALSTQLFNDRLSFEGNLGVSGDSPVSSTNEQSSNVVGDVNVEYKITDDGSVRAKVYNKSNDYDITDATSAPYTQGVGIFYRAEFDTFGEFFNKLFKRKKEKTGSTNGK